ncbi:MAG: AI-2E family transporter, partial [Pyramidobacter sp.]|nr:AI-2E family transporter [Pyramidobacter sp.]
MKHFWEKNEYVKWGITAFLVVAGAILFYMLLLRSAAIFAVIKRVLKVLSPIIWGLVIAYILWPETKYFQYKLFLPMLNRRFPKRKNENTSRLLAVILSITIALLFIGVLLWIVIPQVYTSIESIVSNAPEYFQTIQDFIERFFKRYPDLEAALLQATGNVSDSVVDWARSVVLPNLSTIVTNVSTGVYLVLRGILNVLIGFVVACYVLYHVEGIEAVYKKILYSLFPIRRAEQINRAVNFMDGVFNGFIIGKIIDSLIIGVLCYIVCSIAKMPYVVLISVIVGITNVIPFFGPFIG